MNSPTILIYWKSKVHGSKLSRLQWRYVDGQVTQIYFLHLLAIQNGQNQSFFRTYEGLKYEDRPDIVSRVFKIKLGELLHDLRHKSHFGIAIVYTIEFQKRRLLHAHILLFLDPKDKCPSPTDIDGIIMAELLNPNKDPIANEAVKQFMMRGPCGSAKSKSPCMINGKYTKHFPKRFYEEKIIDEEGFLVYRRRNDGKRIEKNGSLLDN